MHIWIDGQCLQTASADRGIGRYVFNLIKALARHPTKPRLSISLNASMPDEFTLSAERLGLLSPQVEVHAWQGITVQGEAHEGYSHARELSEIALAHHVACIAPDIALAASPFEGKGDRAVPLGYSCGHFYPICAIFYDAIPNVFPKQYLNSAGIKAFYKRRLAQHSKFDAVLGISAFATDQAKELFPQLNVYQVDAGLSDEFSTKASLFVAPPPENLANSPPYVLYVGSLDWRKNVSKVADAFSILPPKLKMRLKFLVAGAYDEYNATELKKRWISLGLDAESIIMLGRVSDDRLIDLYLRAEITIQPSMMEGFGLTALESVMCGTPVIGSNTGALPEVICDPRAIFDPTNPQEIVNLIVHFVDDKNFSRMLRKSSSLMRQSSLGTEPPT